jgi:hypothetical protein
MASKLDVLKQQAPTLVVEAISVVFAVLLALAINEWRQGREEARIASEAMDRLRIEIQQNHDNLAAVLDQQAGAIDALGAVIEDLGAGRKPDGELAFNFRTEQVRNAAWETALLTQAVRFIDFELVSSAADIYELQELVSSGVQRVLDRMSALGASEGEQLVRDLRLVHSAASQLLSLERQLVRRYEAFLQSNAP